MKNLLCLLLSLSISIMAFSQKEEAYNDAVIKLLDAFLQNPENIETYVADNVILVHHTFKKITIKEHSVYGLRFIIGEITDDNKAKPYLEIVKLKVEEKRSEGELIGRNGSNIKFSIQTVDSEDKALVKAEENEKKEFEIVIRYLLGEDQGQNAITNLIQENILYVDNLQIIHCPELLKIEGIQISMINPGSDNIQKCNNKYIQLISYEADKKAKNIKLNYRIIDGNDIKSVSTSCSPCKSFF